MRKDASSPRSTAGKRGDGLHSLAPRPGLLATAGKINNPFLKTLRGGGGGVSGVSGGGALVPSLVEACRRAQRPGHVAYRSDVFVGAKTCDLIVKLRASAEIKGSKNIDQRIKKLESLFVPVPLGRTQTATIPASRRG